MSRLHRSWWAGQHRKAMSVAVCTPTTYVGRHRKPLALHEIFLRDQGYIARKYMAEGRLS